MKQWIKPICFLVGLFLLTMFGVQPFFLDRDHRSQEYFQGFYEEPAGTLDAVFIGGSSVFTSWQPPLGFQEQGITVFNVAVANMPQRATVDVIKECRKTQPDALYILCINQFGRMDVEVSYIHNTLDYMKYSGTRFSMIPKLAPLVKLDSIFQQLEFVLPLIRFHSSWSYMKEDNWHYGMKGFKGGYERSIFRNQIQDITKLYWPSEEKIDLAGTYQEETLVELCDYLEEENINVLFVNIPQGLKEGIETLNAVSDYVRGRGFEVLDYYNYNDELLLDFTSDFYNDRHPNIHGSVKITHDFAQYLVDHYHFTDKRNDPAYESWGVALEKYKDHMKKCALDFELVFEDRTMDLSPVKFTVAERKEDDVHLEWTASEGADAYLLYRRVGGEGWVRAAELPADQLSYDDVVPDGKKRGMYIVIPLKKQGDGTVLYGRFNMNDQVELVKEKKKKKKKNSETA